MSNCTTATCGKTTTTFKNSPPTRSRFNILKYLSIFAFAMLLGVNGVMGQNLLESFTDGDFTSSPTWGGNTSDWAIQANSDAAAGASGSKTLRLAVGSGSGTKYLRTQISSWGTSQEWGFWIGRRAQALTFSNQMHVWLYANESDLTNATVDGYRIAIGDDTNDDEIRLEYIVNGAVSATVITSSSSITNNRIDFGLLIRVTRSSSGAWQIFTSTLPASNGSGAIATSVPNNANASTSQGTATNNSLVPATNGYLGVLAIHSSGTDGRATVELDQVYFSAISTPTTTSISPASAIAGGADFTLTVDGTNFISGLSTVTWGGSNRTTTFVSNTQLTAEILAADIASVGSANVGVTTTGAPANSNTQAFTISAATNPTIITSGTLAAVNTTYGTASVTPTSFTVSGSNLTNDISLSAPSGYEISKTSGGTSGYASSLTISPSSGSVSSTTIYVRIAASTVVNSYSGNITLSSSGANTINVATVSSTVSKKALTITADNQTVSYGTSAATVTGAGTYSLSGFVNSENSSVVTGSVSFISNYTSTTNPGTNVATITPVVTGLSATNYSFTAVNGNISVTALQLLAPTNLSVSGGNNSLSISFIEPSNSNSTGSEISNYKYSLNGGGAFQVLSPAQTVSPLVISGLTNNTTYDVQILAVNGYGDGVASAIVQGTPVPVPTINTSASLTAFTTTYGTASAPQSLVVSGTNLTGDITATAPIGYEVSNGGSSYASTALFTQNNGSVTGNLYVRLSATASVFGSYNSQNIVFSSPGATNINVGTPSSGNLISAKSISISGISISNKVYDGNTSASITGTAEYTGLVNSQTFTVTGTPMAVFINKNVENGKAVTVSGYSAPNSNYAITQPSGLTADITSLTINLTNPLVSSKTYNGTTSATVTGTLNGIISPNVVNLVGTGTYASSNVGTGISVISTSTLSGTDAGNYTLTQPTGLTGAITQKALTITASNVTKETGVQITGGSGSTSFTSSGLVGSETIGSVTITYGDAAGTTGNGAAPGTYIGQVTPSLAIGGSFNTSNYSITYNSGNIIVSGFTPGNLIVERIGDGSTTLGSAASQINLLEFTPSLSLTQTINDLFTSPNLLTESGTGTTAGQLNSYETNLAVPGYNTNLLTASVANLNTKATNILSTNAGLSNRVVFPTTGTVPLDGGSFRSIIPISNNTGYVSGTSGSGSPNGGIWYYNGSTFTQISSITNTRNVEIFNGNLYFSTSSGTQGVYQLANGLPTTSGQSATLIAGTSSPIGFSISPDGKTMYIADDGAVSSNTGGGIQKWSFIGSTWSRVYTFSNAGSARGITVDYSGDYAVIYATSTEVSSSNSIKKIVDIGSNSTPTTISSNTKYVFRGIDFVPAPLPSAPTIGTVTQTTCASSTGSVELTGLPSGQWRIYGFPTGSAVGTGSSTTISGLSAGSYTFVVTSYTGRTSEATASVTINTQPGAPGYPSAPSATASQTFCSGSTINNLSATGTSLQWYNQASGGSTYAPSTALNSAHYYATQTVSGCESTSRTDVTVTVNATNTASIASSTPTLCISTPLTAITHTTTGATGIGTATGLPTGVSASWYSNTITISGTPTASGTFNYSIPLLGGCGSVNATGSISVTPTNTVGNASSTQTLFVNTALTSITHTTNGATNIGTATGLPAGVSASWNNDLITISGTPTALGTFAYSIPLTGGCGSVNATGTITVVNAYTWTGATSSAWSEATNWIPNGVPTAADNVNIPAVSSPNNQIEDLSSLTINSNITFTVKSNAKLTLSGIITNNGTLTIENGATLVQTGTGTNTGSGTYNVKQAITGSGGSTPNGRFWYLGAALSDASSTALLSSAGNQLWQWNEASFNYALVPTGQQLSQGKSYVLRSGQATETINFSGASLTNGTVNVTGLTRSGTTQNYRGCHLISNPYPSYLDWNAITKTNIGTTMYIRTAIGTTLDVMETFNTVNNLATTISSVPLTQYIAPMQGFWVKVPTDGQTGSLTMNNSMRSHQPTGSGLRSTPQDFPAFLRFNMLDGQNKDQVILLMSPDASMSLDNFDSEKMSASGYAQFYSTVNATKLVINGMKNVKAKTSIPLTLVMPTSKSYTFQAEEFNIEDGLILLEDKQEGVIQDLTINPTYSFFGNAGTNATRFVVHFQLATAPVLIGGPQELESLGSDELMSENIQIVSNNQGTVIVRLDEGFKPEGNIRIFDASGRLVEQTDFNDQETTIHLNEQAGMYFVEVSAGKLMVKKKIVIN